MLLIWIKHWLSYHLQEEPSEVEQEEDMASGLLFISLIIDKYLYISL